MVKKFSVGIPDDLAERLEPFKENISPTAVFQEAMAARIEAFESRKNRMKGEDMEAIINRLRKQKEESENSVYKQGEEEGLDFAKTADYDELKYGATVLAEIPDPERLAFDRDGMLSDYFEGLDELADLDEEETKVWLRGWCAAVEQFWDEVSGKL